MATLTHKFAPLIAAASIVRPSIGVLDPDSLPMWLALQGEPANWVIAFLVNERVPDRSPDLLRLARCLDGVDDVAKHVETTTGTADSDNDAVLVVKETNHILTIG